MLETMFKLAFLCIFLSNVHSVNGQAFNLTDAEKATIQNDVNFLTNGVSKIVLTVGYPSEIQPFGKFAYALANTSSMNVWSAARYGAGKICAFGNRHLCRMGNTDLSIPDNARLIQNCIQWITNQTTGPAAQSPVGLITTSLAYNQGFTKSSKTSFVTTADLVGIQFVVMDETFMDNLNLDKIDVLKAFIQRGGGAIVCDETWYESTLALSTTLKANQIFLDAGLAWTNKWEWGSSEVRVYNRPATDFWKVNALYAANEVNKGSPLKTEACILYPSLTSPSLTVGPNAYNQQLATVTGAVSIYPLCCNFPTLIPAYKTSPPKFSCVEYTQKIRQLLPLNYDHPIVKAAKIFPGYPTSARANVTKSVSFLLNYTKWQSTGLYVWPGSTLQAQVPTKLVNSGYNFQFGGHTRDLMWSWSPADEYIRWPIVYDSVPITQSSFSFFTFTGGLLYLDVPSVASSNWETVTITFTGELVSAPWFRLGVTKESEWQSMVTSNVAPWFEIESNLIVATIPTSYLSAVKNITHLAVFKDQMLSHHYDLRGNSIKPHKERIITDIQLDCGCALYAGYPVNGQWDSNQMLVTYSDDVTLVNNYQTPLELYWGFAHEFGHNFQDARWTAEDEGEVTCNIFSLFLEETFPDGPHQFGGKSFEPDIRPSLTGPWKALMFYLDLREAFGWVAFKNFFRLFEANKALTSPGSTPQNDNWLKYFSQTVKRNINSLVTEYGKSVSASAVNFASEYPAWDKYKIIDCEETAIANSPCMTAWVYVDWIYIRMIAWAPINYTDALVLKFIGAPLNSYLKYYDEGLWSTTSYDPSTQTMRFVPPQRIYTGDDIAFWLYREPPSFSVTDIFVKIVNATSQTIHLYERSLEKIRYAEE